MQLALLSGCTTHLKQSLTQTVTAFYAQVANPGPSGVDGDHPLHVAEWAPDEGGAHAAASCPAGWSALRES